MLKNYFTNLFEKVKDCIEYVDRHILNKIRLELKLFFIKFNVGWYWGNVFKIFSINIGEYLESSFIIRIEVQIFKFSITLLLDFENY